MNTDHLEEKRRFHRTLYDADATLTIAGKPNPCRIIDISLKGCLLAFQQPCPVGLGVLSTLSFDLSDDISIVMDVSAVHNVDSCMGFICKHIDIDSITNLRRLVELNLGDSNLLERELASLSHFNDV